MFSLKAKKVMTSFDLVKIVQEINENIVGVRLDNIYQVSPLTLLLVFHPKQRLITEAGKRIHLTQYEVKKPNFPSLFCRILRKLLKGSVVQKVQIEGFERVVSIETSSKAETYKLVIEIFGRGNIILVNSKDIILHALSYRRMKDRKIIRGEPLKLPPSRGYNPMNISRNGLEGLREQKEEVVKAVSKMLTIGGLYAEELLLRASIDKEKIASSLTRDEVDKIYDELRNMIHGLTSREPHIVVDNNGRWIDVLPFPLTIYSSYKKQIHHKYNEAADEYFTRLTFESENKEHEKNQKIDEQKRILNQQKESLEAFNRYAVEKRKIGDIIYQHFSEIQSLFQRLEGERKKGIPWEKSVSSLEERRDIDENLAPAIDTVDLEKKKITIKIDDLHLKLDLQQSVAKNASSFYEDAKKMEGKMEGLRKAIIETECRIENLRKSQLRFDSEREISPIRIRKRAWFEKFYWTRSSEGFLILGGRDAFTNEMLIKKHMDGGDFIFHADIAGAPFVILKTEGKTPSEETVLEAAQLAVSYSRGWREGYTTLDAYWVRPEQVSKQAPSGEFLSRGMFMVRGERNYIHNVPLQVAIGFVEENGLVIGGPVAAVNTYARYKVELIPGRQPSGTIAKTIRNIFATNATKELRKKVVKLKIEEIQRFIPSGKSEVVRK